MIVISGRSPPYMIIYDVCFWLVQWLNFSLLGIFGRPKEVHSHYSIQRAMCAQGVYSTRLALKAISLVLSKSYSFLLFLQENLKPAWGYTLVCRLSLQENAPRWSLLTPSKAGAAKIFSLLDVLLDTLSSRYIRRPFSEESSLEHPNFWVPKSFSKRAAESLDADYGQLLENGGQGKLWIANCVLVTRFLTCWLLCVYLGWMRRQLDDHQILSLSRCFAFLPNDALVCAPSKHVRSVNSNSQTFPKSLQTLLNMFIKKSYRTESSIEFSVFNTHQWNTPIEHHR